MPFCGCCSNSFLALKGTNSKTKLVHINFLPAYTIKGTGITLTVVILDFITLSSVKPRFLTPKKYDDHPRHICKSPPHRVYIALCKTTTTANQSALYDQNFIK